MDFKKDLNARHIELTKGVSSACRGFALAILGALLSINCERTSYYSKAIVSLLILLSVFDIIQYLLPLMHVRKYIRRVRGEDKNTFDNERMYENVYTDLLSDNNSGFGLFWAKIICLVVSLVLIAVQMFL